MGLIGFFIGILISAVLAVYVAQDASKRSMNGALWGIGIFLLCPVFLPMYVVVRRPKPQYSSGGYASSIPRMCRSCGRYYQGRAVLCPHCGKPQWR